MQEAAAAGITVTHRSVSCAELKERMLTGAAIIIALVDKTRLAGHSVPAAAVPSITPGLASRLGLAPSYTGTVQVHEACHSRLAWPLILFLTLETQLIPKVLGATITGPCALKV